MNDLAVIIISYNTKDLLRKCLKSVLAKKWNHTLEVWVVDNASKDGSAEMIKKEFPSVKLIKSKTNRGFAGGNNLALSKAEAFNYLLLNSDTEVTEGSLDIILDRMKENEFDIISCRLENSDGSFQPNAGDLPFGMAIFNWLFGVDDFPFFNKSFGSFHRKDPEYYKNERKVGWISGSVFLITSKTLKSVGLLDAKIFMYCEDVDYCVRAYKAGFTVGWTNRTNIMHIGGGSSNNPQFRQWIGEFRGLIYLYKKYYGKFAIVILKGLIYIAIFFRILAFSVIGKFSYAKIYVKIFKEI